MGVSFSGRSLVSPVTHYKEASFSSGVKINLPDRKAHGAQPNFHGVFYYFSILVEVKYFLSLKASLDFCAYFYPIEIIEMWYYGTALDEAISCSETNPCPEVRADGQIAQWWYWASLITLHTACEPDILVTTIKPYSHRGFYTWPPVLCFLYSKWIRYSRWNINKFYVYIWFPTHDI